MEYQSFLVVRKEIMKYKILILAALMTMCTGSEESVTEQRVVSLSTTHTEIIQVLGGESLLVGVDSFSETELSIEKIDAFTVTAEALVELDPDLVFVAFDFNGIIEGLEKYPGNSVIIMNRNGSEVFKKTDYDNSWNGESLPSTTYYYVVELNDGISFFKGTITIIRQQ